MSNKNVNSIVSPWLEKKKSSNVVRRNNLYEDEMLEEILSDTSTINTNLIDIDKLDIDMKDISDMDLGKLGELEEYFKEIVDTSTERVKSHDIVRDLKYNKLPKNDIVKFNEEIYEEYTPINEGSYARLISVMHNMNYGPIIEEKRPIEEDFVKKEPQIVVEKDLEPDFTDNKLSMDPKSVEEIDLNEVEEQEILLEEFGTIKEEVPVNVEDIELVEAEELFVEDYIEEESTKEEIPVIPKIEIDHNIEFAEDDDDSVYKVEKLNINNRVKEGTEVD